MATNDTSKLGLDDENKMPHMPDEILLEIFSYHQLPSAAKIARDRYEGLNAPKGPLIVRNLGTHPNLGPVQDYRDNELETGACTHEHGEYKTKLRTLSAICKASRNFYRVASPIMYSVYPGQTVIDPKIFIRTMMRKPDIVPLVKQMVIDPWDTINPKFAHGDLDDIHDKYSLLIALHLYARDRNDEACAMLLLLRCLNIEYLAFVLPCCCKGDTAVLNLFTKVTQVSMKWYTLSNAKKEATLQLHNLKQLFIHRAEPHHCHPLSSVYSLMRLASVHSVTVYRFCGDPGTLKGLQHLTSLTLWRSHFHSRDLLDALETCTGLRSLHIIFAGLRFIHGKMFLDGSRVDMNELGKIIRRKLTNLHELRLDDRELVPAMPYVFPSLRRGPALEKLAINEIALGCYTGLHMPNIPLADMLPESLQSLAIYRSDHWWHEANRDRHNNVFEGTNGITHRFDAVKGKIVEFLRNGREKCPQLKVIYLDTPTKFEGSVKAFRWKIERVVGTEVLRRPSVVVGPLVPPKEKEGLERIQVERAEKAAVVLRRGS